MYNTRAYGYPRRSMGYNMPYIQPVKDTGTTKNMFIALLIVIVISVLYLISTNPDIAKKIREKTVGLSTEEKLQDVIIAAESKAKEVELVKKEREIRADIEIKAAETAAEVASIADKAAIDALRAAELQATNEAKAVAAAAVLEAERANLEAVEQARIAASEEAEAQREILALEASAAKAKLEADAAIAAAEEIEKNKQDEYKRLYSAGRWYYGRSDDYGLGSCTGTNYNNSLNVCKMNPECTGIAFRKDNSCWDLITNTDNGKGHRLYDNYNSSIQDTMKYMGTAGCNNTWDDYPLSSAIHGNANNNTLIGQRNDGCWDYLGFPDSTDDSLNRSLDDYSKFYVFEVPSNSNSGRL
jgi:hypothetical protein